MKYSSKKIKGTSFIKTDTIVSSEKEEAITIQKLTDLFYKTGKDRNIERIEIDDNFITWTTDCKISLPVTDESSRLIRFDKDLSRRKVVIDLKRLGIYQKYNLATGIALATQLVNAGELDKKNGKCIYIHLTFKRAFKGTKNLCTLVVWRNRSGVLGLTFERLSTINISEKRNGIIVNSKDGKD